MDTVAIPHRSRAKTLILSVAAAVLLSACAGGAVSTAVGDANVQLSRTPGSTLPAVGPVPALPSPGSVVNPNLDSTVEVIKRVQPAVVNVTTNVQGAQSIFGGPSTGKAVGTGFIVRSDGVIVTNYHVVEGALQIKVTLPPPDNRKFTARVIGGDSAHDLAILKADASGLPTVPLGDSATLQLGEKVIALGYALALPGGPTVTTGIISSLARTVQAQDPNGGTNGQGITRTYEDVLQTDAAINPGNSGGPLVDLAGNVVGINTAGAGSAQNIGFSIAIDAAKPLIQRAIDRPDAPTPFLGVSTVTVGPALAGQYNLPVERGAYVAEVAPGGPAQKAGLQAGDVITSFDGKAVTGSDDLGAGILARNPGDEVTVKVVHANGRAQTYRVTLGSRPIP